MCLAVHVELLGVPSDRAVEIGAQCSSASDLIVRPVARSEATPNCHFSILEYSEGCACNMLVESATSEAATWSFRPEVLPRLGTVLRCLLARTRSGVVFEAAWIGDDEPMEVRVSVRELLAAIEAGSIKTRTRYLAAA